MFEDCFSFFKKFFPHKKRLIVYGDIHGELERLKELQKKIKVTKDDIEVCVGDLFSKGEKPLETFRYIQRSGMFSVVGNHEEKIIKALEKKAFFQDLKEIDRDFIKELSKSEREFLTTLPLFLRFGKFTIVHGGLKNSMDLDNLKKEDRELIINLRFLDKEETIFWGDEYDGSNGFVLFGHKRAKEIIEKEYCLGLDTGAMYGGKLSAAVIADVEKIEYTIVQV